MASFTRCEDCRRHIRLDEPACPFCAASLPRCSTRAGRLGQAAALAVGTVLTGTMLASCATPVYGGPPPDAGPTDAATSGADPADD